MVDNAQLAKNWLGYATEDPAETGREIERPHEAYAAIAQAHALLAVAEAIGEVTRVLGSRGPL